MSSSIKKFYSKNTEQRILYTILIVFAILGIILSGFSGNNETVHSVGVFFMGIPIIFILIKLGLYVVENL